MPNTKAAAKALRVAGRRWERNQPIRAAARTYLTKATKAVAEKPQEEAVASVKAAEKVLDKAAQKGVIHPNKAARLKSRLMKKLNAQKAA